MSPGSGRSPQLGLRLDASPPDPAARWHEGATLAYLGRQLTLKLCTAQGEVVREGSALALPLPPRATPRQIQDRAEAWLRAEAKRLLPQVIEQKLRERRAATAQSGQCAPRLALSFAARGHWVDVHDGDSLRCNWRLIEQPMPVIEQAIARGIAALPQVDTGPDLFGGAAVPAIT